MQAKVKVRDRILNVASDLFSRQGFNQTGINQIIAEADIAIGSLYNHFPSKNDLLLAYLERQQDEWFKGFERLISNVDQPGDKILKFLDYRAEQQVNSDFAGCPFIKIIAEIGSDDPKVLQLVEGFKERQRSLLNRLFKQLRHDSLLDARLFADTFFLMIEGATVTTTITRNATAFESVKKYFKKMCG